MTGTPASLAIFQGMRYLKKMTIHKGVKSNAIAKATIKGPNISTQKKELKLFLIQLNNTGREDG